MSAETVIRTYDAKNVMISYKGIAITGFAEDTFLVIAREGNTFSFKKGADGTVARSNQNGTTFSVKITLLASSPSNDRLLTVMNDDIKNNDGVGHLHITEVGTGTLLFDAQAWIEKDPDASFGKDVGEREWTFRTGAADYTGMASVAAST